MFGPHLIIDGSKCDTAKLANRILIERILTEYPRAIGMTRIGGPYMFEYQAPDPAYSGVSGLVVIAESHIAIHTFPALDYFTMDIFSCKNFDHEIAIDYIREALGAREMDRMLVQRGLSFRGPHHGPLGATDELVAEAARRYAGLEGVTRGSIPADDPLYPKSPVEPDAGQMIWPTYGVTPDLGTYGPDALCTSEARAGAVVVPANAAAAGELARPGLAPIQPVQVNPTASTSGIIERLQFLSGQGRQLGKALAQWEQLARTPGAPVVLALGPHVIAAGLRDVVADLIHRGHVSAIIAEGDTLLADAYESLGFRHYVDSEGDGATPLRTEEEWQAARTALAWPHPWDRATRLAPGTGPSGPVPAPPSGSPSARMERGDVPTEGEDETVATVEVARELGAALAGAAPRPGMLTAAHQKQVPVIAVGATELDAIGVGAIDGAADVAALHTVLSQPGAGVIAFGTTATVAELVAASGVPVHVIAIDAAPFTGPTIACKLDATIALPLLATGLVQRMPQRAQVAATPDSATHRQKNAMLAAR